MGLLNKKGTALDLIFLTISVIMVAVTLLVLADVWSITRPALQEALGDDSAEINASLEAGTAVVATYDYMLLGGIVAIFIGMIILAFMIPASPVWAIVYIVIMIVNIVLCSVVSDTYRAFAESPNLAAEAAALPMQGFIMMNLPLIMFALGLLVLVITFAKPYVFGGGEVR